MNFHAPLCSGFGHIRQPILCHSWLGSSISIYLHGTVQEVANISEHLRVQCRNTERNRRKLRPTPSTVVAIRSWMTCQIPLNEAFARLLPSQFRPRFYASRPIKSSTTAGNRLGIEGAEAVLHGCMVRFNFERPMAVAFGRTSCPATSNKIAKKLT